MRRFDYAVPYGCGLPDVPRGGSVPDRGSVPVCAGMPDRGSLPHLS